MSTNPTLNNSATANASSPQEKLRALRESFTRQIPEKIRIITEKWAGLLANPSDRGGLHDLAILLHTLAGSTSTFGFRNVGAAAGETERLVKGLPASDGTQQAELVEGVSASLALLLAASEHDSGPPPGERSEEAIPDRDHGDRKLPIFLVEDDIPLLESLAFQISCFGYDVRSFSDLADLKQAMSGATPAAIITDMIFPEGENAGAETIAGLRRESTFHVPVVFISRRSDLNARLQAVKAGGDAYFVKPVPIGSLIDKLDTLTSPHNADPYRILIVDDDPELAAYHALTLERYGMTTEIVKDPLQVMKPLVEFNPDLILMDMYMPACNGNELAKVIRQMETFVSIPIVFLSSEKDIDKQLSAMRMGGDDFLTKPIIAEHLIASVTTRAERMRIIRTFMERDSLTGLLNHTRTKEQLELAVLRATRNNSNLSFVMIDIDHFKTVNDTYGHPTGDRVIVILSRLLQQRLRKTDIIGRYGGEEFAVVLPDTDVATSYRVMDEIRQSFAQLRHEYIDGEFTVTFSCGIAAFPAYADGTALNNMADKALYEAKRKGRNRVVTATEDYIHCSWRHNEYE
ncbi:MAG: diguanylate cyclase [Desulfuromonadales bacterium]|nr:diguanylate cyclase [Desulfuromonadales bacterium]